jgi:Zn-dependent protease with chaperone function
MDFFEAQDAARGRTRTLVVLYIGAVLAIIAAVYAVVHVALGPGPQAGVDVGLLLIVAAGVAVLVGIGSGVRTAQLRQGGGKVAELLGGRRVRSNTTDEHERRLVNVVEEMAIASGTPMPAIYVLDHESGINAFAAGYSIDDAAVAVTRGTLERLNRAELQGVIAHEFSHILNGDMRLNVRLMGLLFGILLLAVVGRGLLHGGARGGRRRNGGGGQVAIVGIALLVIGYIGVFFGRLIQAAVSRQREYLADAAAVQFTRDPEGIAGALRKIGGVGSRLDDHHAQEASHLFFANGLGSAFTSLLATHPPVEDRIRRLQPGTVVETRDGSRPRVAAATGAAGFASGAPEPATGAPGPHAGAALIASVGAPQSQHVAYAGRLLQSLPPQVLDAAHDPERAVALLFALLRDDGAFADAQRSIIEAEWPDAAAQADELVPHVRAAGDRARLPLLDLLLPALRELSPEQGRRARATAQRLVEADGDVDMFELALLHVLHRQLPDGATEPHRTGQGARSLESLREEAGVVLSAVAWSGAADAEAAQQAFAAGAAELRLAPLQLALHPREALDVGRIDAALDAARNASAAVRRRLLEACMLTVAHDGRVATQEAELLRAVAEAIDCPMPPVLG